MLAKKGLQRVPSPVPEREAVHLGDAIAGPRTLLYSQPPQAAAGRSGKPCYLSYQACSQTLDVLFCFKMI